MIIRKLIHYNKGNLQLEEKIELLFQFHKQGWEYYKKKIIGSNLIGYIFVKEK